VIILDYSGIAISNIFVQHANDDISEGLLRHMILNTIRMYNVKFKNDYGHMYIACDHRSWRKQVFEYYKANRKKGREESDMDWASIFDWLGKIKEELAECSPYTVVHVTGAEADDIIATLVEQTQEFGKDEPIMIVSSDKDFLQLQKYPNVHQFSSILKKPLIEADPKRYLFEHIIRGDSGDGVPNIFSDDDTFVVDGKRQKPVSKKKLEAMYQGYLNGNIEFEKVEYERNFHRNQKMVDLSKIPADVVGEITTEIQTAKEFNQGTSATFLNYLIQKRCNKLIPQLTEFF
jgi:hypothetical protein